jgi:hypothetical protein
MFLRAYNQIRLEHDLPLVHASASTFRSAVNISKLPHIIMNYNRFDLGGESDVDLSVNSYTFRKINKAILNGIVLDKVLTFYTLCTLHLRPLLDNIHTQPQYALDNIVAIRNRDALNAMPALIGELGLTKYDAPNRSVHLLHQQRQHSIVD